MGNTDAKRNAFSRIPVHPHVCGEHLFKYSTINSAYGSSPRMWGTPDMSRSVCARIRFIPTYVGNTDWVADLITEPSVHPHVCGEHMFSLLTLHPRPGSSPRMWGTHVPGLKVKHSGRFIPTYVGNTPCWLEKPWRSAVHPHVCGEHFFHDCTLRVGRGSSPRMWGTQSA